MFHTYYIVYDSFLPERVQYDLFITISVARFDVHYGASASGHSFILFHCFSIL